MKVVNQLVFGLAVVSLSLAQPHSKSNAASTTQLQTARANCESSDLRRAQRQDRRADFSDQTDIDVDADTTITARSVRLPSTE